MRRRLSHFVPVAGHRGDGLDAHGAAVVCRHDDVHTAAPARREEGQPGLRADTEKAAQGSATVVQGPAYPEEAAGGVDPDVGGRLEAVGEDVATEERGAAQHRRGFVEGRARRQFEFQGSGDDRVCRHQLPALLGRDAVLMDQGGGDHHHVGGDAGCGQQPHRHRTGAAGVVHLEDTRRLVRQPGRGDGEPVVGDQARAGRRDEPGAGRRELEGSHPRST